MSISSAGKELNDTKELTLFFSAYNEYCEVNVEGGYINIKLKIGDRELGTENWFLVLYVRKRLGYFKTVDRGQGIGNQEPETSALFLIWEYITNVSNV